MRVSVPALRPISQTAVSRMASRRRSLCRRWSCSIRFQRIGEARGRVRKRIPRLVLRGRSSKVMARSSSGSLCQLEPPDSRSGNASVHFRDHDVHSGTHALTLPSLIYVGRSLIYVARSLRHVRASATSRSFESNFDVAESNLRWPDSKTRSRESKSRWQASTFEYTDDDVHVKATKITLSRVEFTFARVKSTFCRLEFRCTRTRRYTPINVAHTPENTK